MTAGDDVEQARDPVGRRKAERDLRKPEARSVGRDAKVLRDREHEPSAEREAVDGGDRHLRQRREAAHDRRVTPGERFGVVGGDALHLLDVVAGTEGAAAPGDHEHADVVHSRDPLERLLERGRQAAIERVERLRAVEPQPGDAVLRLKLDDRSVHYPSGSGRRRRGKYAAAPMRGQGGRDDRQKSVRRTGAKNGDRASRGRWSVENSVDQCIVSAMNTSRPPWRTPDRPARVAHVPLAALSQREVWHRALRERAGGRVRWDGSTRSGRRRSISDVPPAAVRRRTPAARRRTGA